jgi:glyoxylase-like metal-dependent hydrolase (beta-lactamase superfamily II)
MLKLILGLFLLFPVTASFADKLEDKLETKMQAIKVSEHIWYVKGIAGTAIENAGFVSNAGFVITGEGVVVFDALGTPALAELLLKEIRKLTNEPIKMVIMSHYHADHIYGLQVFKNEGAEVLAPAGAIDYLNSDSAKSRLEERRISLSPWVNENTRLVGPDRYIKQSEKFKLGNIDFTISALGSAHSEGDLTLFVEPDKVLFSGDVIFDGRIPWLGDADTVNWLATLNSIKNAKLAAVVPGHGELSTDPIALIRLTHDYLEFVRENMKAAIDNWVSFDDAYAEVEWGDYEYLPAFFEANRRNAYQVFLSLEQESLNSKSK